MFPAVVWAAADLIPRQIHPPALYARPVTAESDQMGQSLQHCSADALYTGGTERNRPCALLFPRTQAQRGQQKRERELSVLPAPFTQSCFHHSFAPFPSDRAVRRTAGVEGLETWGNLGTDGTFPVFPIYATKGKLSWRQSGDGFFGRPPGRGARRRRVECSSLARKSGVPRGRPVKVQRRS